MNEKILVLNDKLLLADDKIICVPQAENLQNKTVDPALTSQTVIPDDGYLGLSSVVITAIPTATQAEPSITVSSSGLITASATQTAGYVSAGMKSATKQLTVQAAQTITPGTSNITIAAGKYLTGTQTIKGDSNLIAGNIKSGVSIFGVAGSLVGETIGAVSKGIISVTYPSGSACTVTNGTVTYTALDASGAATFIVDPGTWTVTAGSKTKTVSITQEGQVVTVNLTSLILYSPGNEHSDITGGWSVSPNAYINNNAISLGSRASYYDSVAVINNKIDLTDFTMLHVNMTSVAGDDTAQGNLAVFSADDAEQLVNANNTYNYRLSRVETNSTGEHELDISSFTGSYLVGYYLSGTTGVSRTREFNRVWLT